MRVKLDGADEALRLTVVDKANNPADVAAATKRLAASEARGSSRAADPRCASPDRTSLTRAQLSYVRSAYLAGFAALDGGTCSGCRIWICCERRSVIRRRYFFRRLTYGLVRRQRTRQLLVVREPIELAASRSHLAGTPFPAMD